jgi:AcrR family transcriptional regulator
MRGDDGCATAPIKVLSVTSIVKVGFAVRVTCGVMGTRIFEVAGALPRGRHQLTRDEVAASQRLRIMGALAELMTEVGYTGATIGDVAGRAGVSRSAFYAHFADKEACLFAAYERFADTLLLRMAAQVDDDSGWYDLVAAITTEYLQALEDDLPVARAFLLEMDAAGDAARAKQRASYRQFAEFLKDRHDAFRASDPTLGPLPFTTFHGLVLGSRALVCDLLSRDPDARPTQLAPDVMRWITATIEGAAAAEAQHDRTHHGDT